MSTQANEMCFLFHIEQHIGCIIFKFKNTKNIDKILKSFGERTNVWVTLHRSRLRTRMS